MTGTNCINPLIRHLVDRYHVVTAYYAERHAAIDDVDKSINMRMPTVHCLHDPPEETSQKPGRNADL